MRISPGSTSRPKTGSDLVDAIAPAAHGIRRWTTHTCFTVNAVKNLSPSLVLIAALVGLPGTPAYADNEPTPRPVAAFLQQVDALRTKAHIPGLSVAVVENRSIVLAAGLGYADIENEIPATAQTPYDIASVAKPLSAVVALRLVELGTLDLDRPIAEYSKWAGFCEAFSRQPIIFAKGLRCDLTSHTLRHLLSHTATGVPGTRFSYNPVVYSWGSRPMMAAVDTQFSSLVGQYVFEPAGMNDSARKYRDLPLPDALAQRLAPPYRIDDAGQAIRGGPRKPQGDGAAGGVVSTVLDLAMFDIALDSGALISPASRTEMMTPMPLVDGGTADYGLGWFIQEYNGLKLVWHSGWWEDAYSALYLKIPERNLTLILLANSEGIWWDNPLDDAAVERSDFAQAFFSAFVER